MIYGITLFRFEGLKSGFDFLNYLKINLYLYTYFAIITYDLISLILKKIIFFKTIYCKNITNGINARKYVDVKRTNDPHFLN